MNKALFGMAVALLVLPVACAGEPAPVAVTSGTAAPQVAAGPTTIPQTKPTAGKAMVVGRVLSQQTGAPLPNTSVRLAEVTRQGDQAIYVLDGAHSPGAETNNDGSFSMADIQAREYVLVIGDPYGKYVVVPDDSNRARVWNATADQVLDVGDVRVDLNK